MTLGDFIRSARISRGLTLRTLAWRIGISAPFLSDIEHGRRKTCKIKEIATALGVPIEELAIYNKSVPQEIHDWIVSNPKLVPFLADMKNREKVLRLSESGGGEVAPEPEHGITITPEEFNRAWDKVDGSWGVWASGTEIRDALAKELGF